MCEAFCNKIIPVCPDQRQRNQLSYKLNEHYSPFSSLIYRKKIIIILLKLSGSRPSELFQFTINFETRNPLEILYVSLRPGLKHHRTTQHSRTQTQTYIHSLSGITTHDSSVLAVQDRKKSQRLNRKILTYLLTYLPTYLLI
jgi:hypothetical protein